MLLAYGDMMKLIGKGVIEGASEELVNGTSMDVTLGETVLIEDTAIPGEDHHISLRDRKPLYMHHFVMGSEGYTLAPGEFILAQSAQKFHLPLTISAEYKLKSSMARIGLEHLNAGWCDPGWRGSVLTLELTNVTRYHHITICPGDRIGQMVFFRLRRPVRADKSYYVRGRYNNDGRVQGIKP